MRKLTLLTILILTVAILLTACADKNEGNTFIATVLENNETLLLVEPEAESTEAKSADKISVSITDAVILNANEIEIAIDEIKVGKQVEISYNGGIAESYPAQIYGCYRVKLLD